MKPKTGKTDVTGTFINSLPTNQSYALFIHKEGYVHHSENFNLEGIQDALDPYIINIELTKAEKIESSVQVKSKPIVLNNIFFESGKAELKQESNTLSTTCLAFSSVMSCEHIIFFTAISRTQF